MSFVTRTIVTNSRAIANPTLLSGRTQATRALFSTSPYHQKGPIEATRETLKAADRLVSDAAVKGIETGEAVTSKLKGQAGQAAKQAGREADDVTTQARRSASDMTEDAAKQMSRKASDMTEGAQDAAKQVGRKASDLAKDAAKNTSGSTADLAEDAAEKAEEFTGKA